MKKKKIIVILFLIIIFSGIIISHMLGKKDNNSIENFQNVTRNKSINNSNSKEQKEEKKITLKVNSEVKSALVEQIEPHASYYLEEVCIEENQYVEKGSNILKYTNGTYLSAPYDCVVTKLNLPELEGKILNSHYVEISSNNVLATTINVDEEKINQVKVGLEAKIKISTLEKEYSGYITKVASTASNGKFEVIVEFENDGNIKLGMTASVEMEI